MGWSRPGLPVLSNLVGLVQHCRAAVVDALVAKLQLIFAGGRVFGVVHCWILLVPCSCLILLMLEKGIGPC